MTEAPEELPAELPIPEKTLPLLALLFGIGAIVLVFTFLTVHHRTPDVLQAQSQATRSHFVISYWLDHGYFACGGVAARSAADLPLFFYRATGGHMLTGFIVEKIYSTISGHYSWRLLALHNQLFSLATAVFLALLGFRLARRLGASALHALVAAVCVEALFYTFPGNLMTYWEMSAQLTFIFYALLFLLFEERRGERTGLAWMLVQGAAAFLLTWMEPIAGLAFVVSYAVVSLLFDSTRARLRQLLTICIVPAVLAIAVFAAQMTWVNLRYPDIPKEGSSFLFRSGLDGALTYYDSHLDIATRRDVVQKAVFPKAGASLFQWKWLFLASAAALLTILALAARGRMPRPAVVSLLSLLGAYVFYAAMFSQAVFIHPYLYDVLLYTPLVLALFVVLPAFAETLTERRGIAIAAVFFVAAWVSMVQLRQYATQFPLPVPLEQGR
jgi:hypothetical protein